MNDVVGIKVYPNHNDVGVRKVWEAGGALAEYLVKNSDLIRDKKVLELGSGVGLTGIVIAGLCGTKQVHMTDFTDDTLSNLEHNISMNTEWLNKCNKIRFSSNRQVPLVTAVS